MRYCGSPIALGFGDAGQQKQVAIVDFGLENPVIRTIPVPKFRDIRTLKGDISSIEIEIMSLLKLDHPIWVEVIFSGTLSSSVIQYQLHELTEGTNVVIIRIRPLETRNHAFNPEEEVGSLDDLSDMDVFENCMDARNIPPEERQELIDAFSEILHEMNEEDMRAE